MGEEFLTLRNVSKRFGPVRALADVSLDLARNELLVVLGPTGAGKTTLLRAIAGLESTDSGRILMEGSDISRLPPASRDMAMVFQDFSLYPDWTVRRNLEFPLRAPTRACSADEISERVAWAAGLLEITELIDRPASRLSGGEMQRVAIGRAIVRRPRLFLMDEPLTNLDAKLRESLRVELAVLRRRLDTPMIFVTHDQAEALSMADRIAMLSDGRVLQVGTPEEVYRTPGSPAVARQLGQPPINLIPAARDGDHWATREGERICPAKSAESGIGVLGIRPEDIETSGGEKAARVGVVEDMGPEKIIAARWLGRDIHILARSDVEARPGDEIFPKANPERAVFWPET